MKRNALLLVKDILEAIRDIESFVGAMDFDAFSADKKTRAAVVHEIEIIGEAANNMPRDIKIRYKELPWQDMARMRDKIKPFLFRHTIRNRLARRQGTVAGDQACY
jgi:uncharacterized protein with HEPN domain